MIAQIIFPLSLGQMGAMNCNKGTTINDLGVGLEEIEKKIF